MEKIIIISQTIAMLLTIIGFIFLSKTRKLKITDYSLQKAETQKFDLRTRKKLN